MSALPIPAAGAFHARHRRLLWCAPAALVLLVAGCSELFVAPAPPAPASVAVSFSLGSAAGAANPGAVFDQVTQVRIRLAREGVPELVSTLDFNPTTAEARLSVPVQLRSAHETAQLSIELLRGQDVLFRGSAQSVELRAGQTTRAPVAPVSVPGGVRVPESVPELTSLGDTVQLTGSVTFATGDDIPGLSLTWSTQNTDIVEVSPQGQVIARAEGTAVVVGTFEGFSRSVNVRVNPLVAVIALEPATPNVLVGSTIQLTATLRDARNNVLANRAVENWSSSNTAVVTVDGTGHVTGVAEGTATITARHGTRTGTAEVTVSRAPPPGRDVVVLNDVNPFDNPSMAAQGTDNPRFLRNLLNFTTQGPRNAGTVVMWDCGRNPPGNYCTDSRFTTTRAAIATEGYTLTTIASSSGTLVNIPANVKSIWLWLPRVFYTNAEINALKQFAAEGGRIVFIGEWDGFYTQQGLAVQNDFLAKMGAVLRNTGGAVDCGVTVIPSSSLRPHQITQGVNRLSVACASVIEPGPQDYVLFYDSSGTRVLAGVATIDTRPLSTSAPTQFRLSAPALWSSHLNPMSDTGQ